MGISRGVGDLKCPNSPEAEKRRDEYFKTIAFNGVVGQKMQEDWFGQPF
jgi:salicylate hydroxylase